MFRCVFLVTILALFLGPVAAHALEAGDAAPTFEAVSTQGTIRLADYAGKKNVLLAFYLKDFTGG